MLKRQSNFELYIETKIFDRLINLSRHFFLCSFFAIQNFTFAIKFTSYVFFIMRSVRSSLTIGRLAIQPKTTNIRAGKCIKFDSFVFLQQEKIVNGWKINFVYIQNNKNKKGASDLFLAIKIYVLLYNVRYYF